MKNGITFQFKDIFKERVAYSAFYSIGGKLTLEKIEYDPAITGLKIPKISKKSRIPNAWPVFYKNATFDSILSGISLSEERKRRNTKNESDDWLHPYKFVKVRKANGIFINSIAENDGAFLRSIGDNPDRLLYNSNALSRFVRILWSAKTGITPPYINTIQKEIKEMLIKNLIPQHKGGRKYRPNSLDLARALLKKLANYLSKYCMTFLRNQKFYSDRRDSFAPEQWNYNYSKIIEWAKTYEYRISILNKKRLKDLITKPADYADSILEESLSIGLRTINKPSSAK